MSPVRYVRWMPRGWSADAGAESRGQSAAAVRNCYAQLVPEMVSSSDGRVRNTVDFKGKFGIHLPPWRAMVEESQDVASSTGPVPLSVSKT